tara:strand:+ start:2595 stop:5606 length:3012 start_codon:yes stop_codon:yes gene_type:complete
MVVRKATFAQTRFAESLARFRGGRVNVSGGEITGVTIGSTTIPISQVPSVATRGGMGVLPLAAAQVSSIQQQAGVVSARQARSTAKQGGTLGKVGIQTPKGGVSATQRILEKRQAEQLARASPPAGKDFTVVRRAAPGTRQERRDRGEVTLSELRTQQFVAQAERDITPFQRAAFERDVAREVARVERAIPGSKAAIAREFARSGVVGTPLTVDREGIALRVARRRGLLDESSISGPGSGIGGAAAGLRAREQVIAGVFERRGQGEQLQITPEGEEFVSTGGDRALSLESVVTPFATTGGVGGRRPFEEFRSLREFEAGLPGRGIPAVVGAPAVPILGFESETAFQRVTRAPGRAVAAVTTPIALGTERVTGRPVRRASEVARLRAAFDKEAGEAREAVSAFETATSGFEVRDGAIVVPEGREREIRRLRSKAEKETREAEQVATAFEREQSKRGVLDTLFFTAVHEEPFKRVVGGVLQESIFDPRTRQERERVRVAEEERRRAEGKTTLLELVEKIPGVRAVQRKLEPGVSGVQEFLGGVGETVIEKPGEATAFAASAAIVGGVFRAFPGIEAARATRVAEVGLTGLFLGGEALSVRQAGKVVEQSALDQGFSVGEARRLAAEARFRRSGETLAKTELFRFPFAAARGGIPKLRVRETFEKVDSSGKRTTRVKEQTLTRADVAKIIKKEFPEQGFARNVNTKRARERFPTPEDLFVQLQTARANRKTQLEGLEKQARAESSLGVGVTPPRAVRTARARARLEAQARRGVRAEARARDRAVAIREPGLVREVSPTSTAVGIAGAAVTRARAARGDLLVREGRVPRVRGQGLVTTRGPGALATSAPFRPPVEQPSRFLEPVVRRPPTRQDRPFRRTRTEFEPFRGLEPPGFVADPRALGLLGLGAFLGLRGTAGGGPGSGRVFRSGVFPSIAGAVQFVERGRFVRGERRPGRVRVPFAEQLPVLTEEEARRRGAGLGFGRLFGPPVVTNGGNRKNLIRQGGLGL